MEEKRYSRQSFLGGNSETLIGSIIIGVVGLGGGGSHIVQQLAHAGFKNYVLYDPDIIKYPNLTRNIGATESDALFGQNKTEISERQIRALHGNARIRAYTEKWQNNPIPLRECDIIVGGVDGFAERRDLEATARRYLIPYIDVGMTITHVLPEPPRMSGQVFVSMPGHLCMKCVGLINEGNLSREAANYGDAGPRPQVVWANGLLASTAIGILVNLITGWSGESGKVIYLMYDGNKNTIQPHARLGHLDISAQCPHYPDDQVGDPRFRAL
jgi:hypothetical protein